MRSKNEEELLKKEGQPEECTISSDLLGNNREAVDKALTEYC